MNSTGGHPINMATVTNTMTTVYPSAAATSQYVTGISTSGATWTSYPTNAEYDKLTARVEALEKRLAILQPNETMQEKYPALQEAYDAYKIIEKLVSTKGPDETHK
jgi:hypothetical protein